MHIVNTMMVIAVTIFTCGVFVAMIVIVVIRPLS
ncbi:Uncharacterised protein [Raoultella planticola]|uniref:Uncharacterized protein n=1 Tax=Raoultella planticola TaxID=575 RepID=A0A485AC96_RAOPL|nr:Uncharacterised protein [Raoultella planticola]